MSEKRNLIIKDLHAEIEGKEILKGINLNIKPGEIHALMGPNGSGKSTLANVIMGHPKYKITKGRIIYKGEDINDMPIFKRAHLGLFLAFQYPTEISGVTIGKFLKRVLEAQLKSKDENAKFIVSDYIKNLRSNMDYIDMDQKFINRYLNEGFSGGEKKRMEILQMLMLKPGMVVMDETDSGLDIDALRIVSKGVNRLRGEDFSGLIITHYQRILNYIKPDFIHILLNGKIVTSGGKELVETLEEKGYDWVKEKYGIVEEEIKVG